MSNNTVFLDSSTNKHVITVAGDSTQGAFSPFAQGWSAYFDGAGDFISFTKNTTHEIGTGDFTWEAFVYFENNTGDYSLYSSPSSGDMDIRRFSDGTLRIGRANIGFDNTSSVISVANKWTHLAISRNSSNLRMFADGVQIFSGSNTTNYTTTTTVQIGRTGANNSEFLGYMSNVRLIKGTSLYNGAFTPPTTALTAVAGTSLLTLQNNRLVDNSTNNSNLIRNGDINIVKFNPFAPATEYDPGFSGYSCSLNGSAGNYATVGSAVPMNFGSSNFTIECWINTTVTSVSVGASRTIIGNSGNSFQMQLYMDTSGRLTFGNTGAFFLRHESNVADGKWHHIAIVRSGTGTNQTAMFVDGTRVALGTNPLNYTSGTIFLGSFDASNGFWNGYISNLRIVKDAVYNAASTSLTVPTTTLVSIANTDLLVFSTNLFVDSSSNSFTLNRFGLVNISNISPFFSGSLSTVGSAYFDGSGDLLSTAASNEFNFAAGDFTVEAWVRVYANGSAADTLGNTVLKIGSSPTSIAVLLSISNTGTVSGSVSWNGSAWASQITGTVTAYPRTWNHVALSRQGTTLRLFVNGALAGSTTNSTDLSTFGTQLYVGSYSNLTRTLNGHVSNLRVVKGSAVYNAAFSTPSGPVQIVSGTSALLNFNAASMYDAARNVTISQNGGIRVDGDIKKFGTGSLRFNGTNSGLTIQDSPDFDFGAGDYTIEFWIYYVAQGDVELITKKPTASFGPFDCKITSAGQLQFRNYTGGAGWVPGGNGVTPLTNLQTNVWSHVALVRNGGTLSIYLNGVKGNDASISGTLSKISDPVTIGVNKGNGWFNGYLDDIRITKGVARYTANFTPPTSKLKAI